MEPTKGSMHPVCASLFRSGFHLPSLLFLAGYCLWLYQPIPFGDDTFAQWEINRQFYPWTEFWVRQWRDTGSYPLWDPYAFGGSPFLGNIQTTIYYPTMFLLPLLSPIHSFGWTLLLHTFLCSVMMYLLIFHLTHNRLAAVAVGLAYCSGGFVTLRAYHGHITIMNSLPWLPAAVWAFFRWLEKPNLLRWVVLTLIVAFQILGGQPQIPFLTLLLLGLLALGYGIRFVLCKEKDWGRSLLPLGALTAATIAAVLLASVFWYPFYEFNQVSAIRSEGFSYEWATNDSLPPHQLFSFFLPFLFGDLSSDGFWGSRTGYWEVCAFLGVGTVVFFLIGLFDKTIPGRKTWIVSILVLLVLALGSQTIFYGLFYLFFPFVRYMRVPARLILPASLGVCVIAGYGLDRMLRNDLRQSKQMLVWLSVLPAGLLLVVLLFLTFFPGHIANHPSVLHWVTQSSAQNDIRSLSDAIQVIQSRIQDSRQSLFIGLCFLLPYIAWCWLRFFQPSWKKISAGLLLVLMAFEMGWFAHRFITPIPAKEQLARDYPTTETLRFLQEHTGLSRVMLPDLLIGWRYRWEYPELIPNCLMLSRLEPVRGFDQTFLKTYADYIYQMQGLPVPERIGAFLNLVEPRYHRRTMLSALNVKYLLMPEPLDPVPADFQLVFEGRPLVYEYRNAFPRAYLLPETLAIPARLPEDALVEISRYTPNEIRIEATLENKGWLVVADNHYHEWKAEVNGQPVEIERVLHTFRGLLLEPGTHSVRMFYDPIGYRKGRTISLTTLIVLGLLSLAHFGKVHLWKPKRPAGHSERSEQNAT